MVKRWFLAIGKEIRGLHEAAYLLGAFAFLSLVLALARDKILAFTFGAGHLLDIYYAAFRIPDLIFVSIGSLVSASILLPYFINEFGKSKEDGQHFSDSIFTVFFGLMSLTAVLAYILAPYLVPRLIPGFSNDAALAELVRSMRIMLLSPFFLGLSNLFSSLTQMHHRFLVYAASPVLYNAGIICGILIGYPIFGISGLALGVAFGALMHVGIQVPFIIHEGLLPKFSFRQIEWLNIKKVMLTSLPRTITLSANQIATFFLVSMASLMTAGSISIFNFAFNLQSVPLTLIGASYSSAVFPLLSRFYHEKDLEQFLEKMITAARHIIFWSMPLTVLFIVLRAQIVRVILGAGKFDWSDTKLTAAMLALFTLSTIGQSLIVLFVRAFYAEGKTARPLLINAISASFIIASAYLFIFLFSRAPLFSGFIEALLKVDGQTGTVVLALALAYTLGVILNTILHWWTFERVYRGFTKPVLATLYHSFAASVIMGYVTFLSLRLFAPMFPITRVWGLMMQAASSALVGLAAMALVLVVLKNPELKEVWRTLHEKIWKVKVPPAEVERIQ